MTGLASRDELTALWSATKDALLARLQGRRVPSGELLAVARRFLRDNGALGAPSEDARKDLERMHRLYRQRLLEALDQPKPPSTVLAEARQYASRHASDRGLSAAIRTSAEELLALDVPFPQQ